MRQSERPKCCDDCFDLIPSDDDFGRDINIKFTLNELIDTVRDYPCMVAKRRLNYKWAKMNEKFVGIMWR